jgi:hypothetical protein
MPFERLSIKSALQLAQGCVSLHHQRGDFWVVRTRYGTGADAVTQTGPLVRWAAREARRERRIFVALRALGLEASVALGLSVKAKRDKRDWRKLVALYVEQYDLGR